MRPETDMQSLGAPQTQFRRDRRGDARLRYAGAAALSPRWSGWNHVHHAGNSSGIVDGSAAVLVASKAMGEKYGLKPRAKMRAMGSIGSEPLIMLTGPEGVATKVLKKAGMSKA